MTFKVTIRGVTSAAREYDCPTHGPFDLVVDLATSSTPRPCPECGAASERTVTTNIATHIAVGFNRGKSDPPPNKYALDTRPLAEGKETLKEFRKRRRGLHRDARRNEAKQKGLLR